MSSQSDEILDQAKDSVSSIPESIPEAPPDPEPPPIDPPATPTKADILRARLAKARAVRSEKAKQRKEAAQAQAADAAKHPERKVKPGPAAPSGPAIQAQSVAAHARWSTESALEDDLRALFSTILMEDGLALLARMRQNCETAARALETRRTAETLDTACVTCGVTKRQLGQRNWRMIRPRRDNTTGTYMTEYFCSDVCIIAENKKKYGVAAMSDRGMAVDAEELERRSKSNIQAHQEKTRKDAELARDLKKLQKFREKHPEGEAE